MDTDKDATELPPPPYSPRMAPLNPYEHDNLGKDFTVHASPTQGSTRYIVPAQPAATAGSKTNASMVKEAQEDLRQMSRGKSLHTVALSEDTKSNSAKMLGKQKELERGSSSVTGKARAVANAPAEAVKTAEDSKVEDSAWKSWEAAALQVFHEFDKDGNGTIDRTEFVTLLNFLGQDMTPEVVEETMKKLDTDGNGVIDYREFLPWLEQHHESIEQRYNDLQEAFKVFDPSGQGKVKTDEFATELANAGVPAAEVKETVQAVDPKKKGWIDVKGFLRAYTRVQAGVNKKHPGAANETQMFLEVFREHDKDGNGLIDKDELPAILRICGFDPTEEMVDKVLHDLDADKNGSVDFEELLPFLQSHYSREADNGQELKTALKTLDPKNEGKIPLTTLKDVLTTTGDVLSTAEFEKTAQQIPVDKKGNVEIDAWVSEYAALKAKTKLMYLQQTRKEAQKKAVEREITQIKKQQKVASETKKKEHRGVMDKAGLSKKSREENTEEKYLRKRRHQLEKSLWHLPPPLMVVCWRCDGSGAVEAEPGAPKPNKGRKSLLFGDIYPCEACHTAGWVLESYSEVCTHCHGTGRDPSDKSKACPKCFGSGV